MTSKLLVVDDDPDFAAFVAIVGQKQGFDVRIARTVREFRALYHVFHPDVITLDIVMPEADGIEHVQWLTEQGCRARILVISGHNPLYAMVAKKIGRARGGLEIVQLQKPVELAVLRRHLGTSSVASS